MNIHPALALAVPLPLAMLGDLPNGWAQAGFGTITLALLLLLLRQQAAAQGRRDKDIAEERRADRAIDAERNKATTDSLAKMAGSVAAVTEIQRTLLDHAGHTGRALAAVSGSLTDLAARVRCPAGPAAQAPSPVDRVEHRG